jgi:ketosteroid isomerase-like protein
MKRLWIAISLAIGVFAANAQGPSTEQTIRQLESEFLDALRRRDINAMEKFYASDYTFTNEDGALLTKQQRLDTVGKSRFQATANSFDQFAVRQYGNVAVVTAHFMNRGFRNPAPGDAPVQPAAAKEVTNEGRFTQVWVKQDRWRMVTGHFSQFPAPERK